MRNRSTVCLMPGSQISKVLQVQMQFSFSWGEIISNKSDLNGAGLSSQFQNLLDQQTFADFVPLSSERGSKRRSTILTYNYVHVNVSAKTGDNVGEGMNEVLRFLMKDPVPQSAPKIIDPNADLCTEIKLFEDKGGKDHRTSWGILSICWCCLPKK